MPPILKANHPYLRDLKQYADRLTRHAPINPPLKNILAVGAVCDAYGNKGLSTNDRRWLQHTFAEAHELKVDIELDFLVHTPNIDLNNTDFLDPNSALKGDVLAVCFIPLVSTANEARASGVDQMFGPVSRGIYKISPHEKPDAWRKAALRSGVRLILTFSQFTGYESEVCGKEFEGDNFILWDQKQFAANKSDPFDFPYQVDILVKRDFYKVVKSRQVKAGLRPG